MGGKKAYLIITGILCAATAACLASSAINIYLSGEMLRASGNMFAPIYSPEVIAAHFARVAPLFFGTAGFVLAGIILGIRDEKADRPAGVDLSPKAQPIANGGRKTAVVRTVVLIAAVIFILLGVMNGSMLDVLVKAKAVCTECIGLG